MSRHTTTLAIVILVVGPLTLHAHPGHGDAAHTRDHSHNVAPGIHPLPPGGHAGTSSAADGLYAIYENLVTTGFRYTLFDQMIADDLHMISGGDMEAFSFIYAGSDAFCHGYWQGNATIRFYENNATNTLLPSSATLIESFVVPIEGSAQSTYLRHVELATPVTLPQHIWMGISFDFGVIGGSGAVTAAAEPTVGFSFDAHYTAPAGYATNPHTFAYANYAFAVYIPSPGSGLLLALGGLWACRRRRSD